MLLNYETKNGKSKTKCPVVPWIKAGRKYCIKRCEYFAGIDFEKQIVDCKGERDE